MSSTIGLSVLKGVNKMKMIRFIGGISLYTGFLLYAIAAYLMVSDIDISRYWQILACIYTGAFLLAVRMGIHVVCAWKGIDIIRTDN